MASGELAVVLALVQPEIPFGSESAQDVRSLLDFVGTVGRAGSAGECGGVAEEVGGDGCGRAIHGVGGIAGDVEKELEVDLGKAHAEVGGQGRPGRLGPPGEGVSAHGPILAYAGELTDLST